MDNKMLAINSSMRSPYVFFKNMTDITFHEYVSRMEKRVVNTSSRLGRLIKKAFLCTLLFNIFISGGVEHPFTPFLVESAYAAHPIDTVSIRSNHQSNLRAHLRNKMESRGSEGKGFKVALIVLLTLIVEFFLFFGMVTVLWYGMALLGLALLILFIAVIPISVLLINKVFRGKGRGNTIYY